VGRKTSEIASSPWDFVTLPEEDRTTARGNMHRKIGKDRACGSGDILSDRQTHIQTHRQTDRQTDRQTLLITILRHCSHGRSNKKYKDKSSAVAEMGDRGHSRHGPKRGEAAMPHSRKLGPRLIQYGLDQGPPPCQVPS